MWFFFICGFTFTNLINLQLCSNVTFTTEISFRSQLYKKNNCSHSPVPDTSHLAIAFLLYNVYFPGIAML